MPDLAAEKSALRAEAARIRDAAHAAAGPEASARACARLLDAIGAPDGPVSIYLPIRSELDPGPAMEALAARGATLCAPVVAARAAPLIFRLWRPGCVVETGSFGVKIPCDGPETTPRIVVAPLLAFDRRGMRLGYGGGYYDRTLSALRAQGPVRAIGFAYAAQEVDAAPCDELDAPLDMIVTETETIVPARMEAAR